MLVHYVSWLSVILTGLATAWWAAIVASRPWGSVDMWAALEFTLLLAIPLGSGTLLLGVVPSSILYFTNTERRDRMSLLLAGCSLLAIIKISLSQEVQFRCTKILAEG